MRILVVLAALLALTLTPAAARKSPRQTAAAGQAGYSAPRGYRGDPDPFIRGSLLREQQWRKGGS